jgi:16S rRNA (cytosine1402-N4)-methyltransferase
MEAPTFYHTTVLLREAVEALSVKPDGVYVDATFGGGGHSKAILAALGPKGKLIAFDHDADAWRNKPDDARLIPVTENFRYIKRFLRLHGHAEGVDGVLADLGVSSWQFDTGARGFSTRFDGPLDMRMDHRNERTAADILNEYSETELHKLFERWGEVRNARQLAKHIVTHRAQTRLTDIESLKALIGPVIKGPQPRYLAQVFQALRIEVNEELEALKEFLEQSPSCLKQGGRLAVISFHSLEDRIVKTFMKRGVWEDETNEFGQVTNVSMLKPVGKPIEPGEEELKNNPRSRSAKLRIAERI